MIEIKRLREYYTRNRVFATQHVAERCRQRGIRIKDIREAVMNGGEIIEQYPDDFPFSSCLVFGYSKGKRAIHIVMSDEGTCSKIITAYFPDTDQWEAGFKRRKER